MSLHKQIPNHPFKGKQRWKAYTSGGGGGYGTGHERRAESSTVGELRAYSVQHSPAGHKGTGPHSTDSGSKH